MSKAFTQEELLRELEPVVEGELNRHLSRSPRTGTRTSTCRGATAELRRR